MSERFHLRPMAPSPLSAPANATGTLRRASPRAVDRRPVERTLHAASASPARGAASLVVVMGLLLVLLLGAAYAGRSLLLEQKASAAQYRGTQAFEAAEAGLEWTLAQLNGGRIDAQCQPSEDPTDASLRERTLQLTDSATGSYAAAPPTGSRGTPACLRGEDGAWHCSCPASGSVNPSADTGPATQPAFRMELSGAAPYGTATTYPGVVQLRAQGCVDSRASAALCAAGDGVMAVTEQAALIPALANLPVATLSAQGSVDASSPSIGVHNEQPGGLLIDAGADLLVDNTQLSGAAGASADDGLVRNDPAWAAGHAAQSFLALFGVPAVAFPQLPAVVTLHCPADCTATLQGALAHGARMLWIDNDLAVSGIDIGEPAAPVLIVAAGGLQFDGNVRCTGLIYGSSWHWHDGQAGSAWLHGAAVIAGDVQLQDGADLSYDSGALATLHRLTGSFVRVPGSWMDLSS